MADAEDQRARAPRSTAGGEVFMGLDAIPAIISAATTGAIGVAVTLAARHVHLPGWPVAAAAAAATAVAAGWRYRLTIGAGGIELVLLRAWIVPTRRQRWLLDADVDLYESWEASAPEGLCIVSRRALQPEDSDCFGPTGQARIRALFDAVTASIARWRSTAPPCPPELRHPVLGAHAQSLDLADATRTAEGRLTMVTSRAEIALGGGVKIPPGSRFRLNYRDGDDAHRFTDPRRADRLIDVEVAGSVLVHGLPTQPGAVLSFADQGAGPVTLAQRAFDREVQIEGRAIRGDEPVGFAVDGTLTDFTLARPIELGGFVLAAGSRCWRSAGMGKLLPITWTCYPGAPLVLPETTLAEGESCQVSADLSRIIGISPRNDLTLPEGRGRIRGGVMPVPLMPDGRIDLAACRKRHLVDD